jgi:hypothetical protein
MFNGGVFACYELTFTGSTILADSPLIQNVLAIQMFVLVLILVKS